MFERLIGRGSKVDILKQEFPGIRFNIVQHKSGRRGNFWWKESRFTLFKVLEDGSQEEELSGIYKNSTELKRDYIRKIKGYD